MSDKEKCICGADLEPFSGGTDPEQLVCESVRCRKTYVRINSMLTPTGHNAIKYFQAMEKRGKEK